jgi:hypothetical protein
MRKYQSALLAGAAALTLMAGSGLASAQTIDQKGGTPAGHSAGAAVHGAANSMKGMGSSGMQAKGQGKAGETAQNANPGGKGAGLQTQDRADVNGKNGMSGAQQNAKTNERGKGSLAQQGNRHGMEKSNQNARNVTPNGKTNKGGMATNTRTEHGRQSTAQQQHIPRGLQGNASGQMQGANATTGRVETSSGKNIRLSERQRTDIRRTVIDARNAPRVSSVQFNVGVGTVIPRPEYTRIHVVPVPEYLVRIEPRWRGLEYFVFRDEVVIVNPRDLRIIAIVPV